MLLNKLPNELILCVAECLDDEGDIGAFVRTNRHLHKLLNFYLYRHNIKYREGIALYFAAWKGRDGTARKAIEAGATIDQRWGWREETALHKAAQHGQLSTATLLIESGADLRARDGLGYAPILCAIEAGQVPLTQLFMSKGVDPREECKHVTYHRCTALHVACHMGHCEMVEFLLGLKFDANALDGFGKTPLQWTIYGKLMGEPAEKMNKIMRMLLSHNANLAASNFRREGPRE